MSDTKASSNIATEGSTQSVFSDSDASKYSSPLNDSRLEDLTESSDTNSEINEQNLEHDATESQEPSDSEVDLPKEENKWEDVLGSGRLMKLIITEGQPDTRPQRLQKCRIKYECTLDDGTLVEKNDCYEFELGDCEVIQGLDLALGLMNVGEVCKLKIESKLAYGSKGLLPFIPPHATVYYEVQLLSVEFEDELENLTISERRSKGNQKRERGNWWYSRDENQLAIQCYRRALDYLDEVEGGITKPTLDGENEVTDAALQQILEDRISVSNNMAAAQLKLELYDAALQSLQTVLRCQPDNVKALFRKAKVHRVKNEVDAALSCLKKAEKLMPNNSDIVKEINILQKLKGKQKASEKELARRMFNHLQPDNNKEKKHSRSSASKLYIWTTVGASIALGLAGLAAYRFKLT